MNEDTTKKLDTMFQGKSIPEYDTLDMAMNIPQEQAIKAIKLATNTNMTLADAAENVDTVLEDNITANDLADMRDKAPKTASFLNNPIYLSSARSKKAIESLTNTEGAWRDWEALKNGVKGIGRGLAGMGTMLADLGNEGEQLSAPTLDSKVFDMDNIKRLVAIGINPMAREQLGNLSKSALQSDYLKMKNIQADSQLGQLRYDLEQNIPQLAAQIAVAYLTGGAGSMAFMGTQIAGDQYADLKEQGVNTDRATFASLSNAALQMPLERIGLGSIMSGVAKKGVKQKVAKIVESTLTEGMTEFLQQYPDDISTLMAKNADKPLEERLQLLQDNLGTITSNAIYAGLISVILGGGASGIHVALQKNVLAANEEQLNNSIEQTGKSPLIQSSPETLVNFKNELAGNEKYYVDGQAILTYAQTNGEVYNQLGLKEDEVKQAAQTEQMIPVQVGNYEVFAAQNHDAHKALKNDIAFDEDGITQNRITYKNTKDINKAREDIYKQQEALQNEKDDIYNNLRRVGLNDTEATSTQTLLVSHAYQMNPDNPAQWLKDNAPVFMRGKAGQFNQYSQAQGTPKTGVPFSMPFYHNTAKTPKMANDEFAQSIEPAGEYVGYDEMQGKNKLEGFEYGNITFNNPLVLDHKSTGHGGWKTDLSKMFGGKKGKALTTAIKKAGYDGIITVDNGKVSETVNVSGKKNEPVNKNNLVAVHNLSIENLLHSNKMGGIAVPSVAITNIEHPLEGFGEITLIGDTYLINPSTSKNKVFNADIYSPRYPEVITDVDSKKIDKYADEVKALADYKKIYQYRKPSIDDLEDDAKGGTRKLVYSTIARLMYASRNGLSLDADHKALDEFMDAHKDGFNAFLEDFLNDVSKGEKIFKGFTNLGNRKYIPHTLENVVKELTKSLQDGEGFSYGLGTLRAVVAKRYKTLKEIQKDRDKIISKEDFDKAKEVLQKEFDEITTEAINKYTHKTDFNTIDNFIDILKEGIKRNNIEKELHDFGFEGMDVNRIRAFLTAIKNFPTEYFEAKIQRAVGINEFSGAVIPKNSPQKVRDILTKNGVPFKEYEEGQRQNVVQSFSNELNEQMEKWILFQQNNGQKGTIGWDADGRAIISLFEGADASTVIHETVGHYFVENLIRKGAEVDAPEWMKKDRQTMLDYAGVTDWDNISPKERTSAHEKFAEAAESYVMQGEAPNKQVQPALSRFKKWLLAIYDTIKRSPNAIPLTDDVKQVFDRLLVGEAKIQEAERVENFLSGLPKVIIDALPADRQKALAKQIEVAHEKAVNNLAKASLENFTQERKETINKYREEVRPDVEKVISEQPLYKTSDMLLEDNPTYKTAKGIAEKYLELADVESTPNEEQAMWLDKFDILAESTGYTSGDELAKKIISEPSKEQAIRQAIDDKVKVQFPDFWEDKKKQYEAAKEALYNDESGLVVAEEARIIEEAVAKQQGIAETSAKNKEFSYALRENMKLAAQDFLASQKIVDASNVQKYMTAERKASEKAAVALSKKDYITARELKRVQLYNHSLVQEALNIRREFEKNKKFLRRMRKTTMDTWRKEEHFVQAAAIMERFGIVRKDYDPNLKRESLREWADRMNEMYDNVAIEPWLFTEKAAYNPEKMLSIGELTDVVNALKNIKKVAQDEGKLSKTMNGELLADVVTKLTDQLAPMKDVYIPQPGKDEPMSIKEKYKASEENRDTFLDRLDNWKQGLFTQIFGDTIEEANNSESQMKMDYYNAEAENKKKYFTKQDEINADKKVYYEELQASVDKWTLIELALNTGSESSRVALFGTPPVGLEKSTLWTPDKAQTEANVMNFLGKNLNANEWNYVQGAWNNMKFLWPLAQEVQKQATGFSKKGVDALPFEVTLADGTKKILQGGYHPLKRDSRTGSKPHAEENADDPLYKQNASIRTLHTQTGYQKARTGASYPVILAKNTRYSNVEEVIHDINFRLLVNDMRKLMNSELFTSVLKQKIGRERYSAFKDYLTVAANPWTESVGFGDEALGAAATWLRSKTVNAAIMLNIKTAMQNLGNFALYANSVEGFTYADMLNGVGKAVFSVNTPANHKNAQDFVYSHSVYMKERSGAPDFTIREMKESNQQNAIEKKATEWGTQLLVFTDNLSAIPMWLTAYEKQINLGKTEKQAVKFADSVIRRTLGSSRITDVAPMIRGGKLAKLLTMFGGFSNTQYQQWAREYNIFLRDKDIARLTAFVASKWLIFCFANMLTSLKNPFDEKDRQDLYADLLTYPLTLNGPAGQFGAELVKRMGDFQSYGFRLSAIQSSLDNVINTGGKVKKVVKGEAEVTSLIEPVAGIAGLYYGVPAQINKLFFNAYDILFNGMEPSAEDIIRRRPKKER